MKVIEIKDIFKKLYNNANQPLSYEDWMLMNYELYELTILPALMEAYLSGRQDLLEGK